MDNIRVGSFVRLENQNQFGDDFWCEVLRVNPPIMGSEPKPEQTYHARHWIPSWLTTENDWSYFTLAPDTAHKPFIAEVLNLDPAVADIFRETAMKGKK